MGNGVKTSASIETGMTTSCKEFHLVASTTTCTSIQKYYKVPLAQLVKWNPVFDKSYNALLVNYNECVGV
jgi:hypothetical protein